MVAHKVKITSNSEIAICVFIYDLVFFQKKNTNKQKWYVLYTYLPVLVPNLLGKERLFFLSVLHHLSTSKVSTHL